MSNSRSKLAQTSHLLFLDKLSLGGFEVFEGMIEFRCSVFYLFFEGFIFVESTTVVSLSAELSSAPIAAQPQRIVPLSF
jgi:hypothetical protein